MFSYIFSVKKETNGLIKIFTLKRTSNKKTNIDHYIKAFNHKIIPILLTIFSTSLGLIPFLINGEKEIFWFSLAAGTIGGLLFSILVIIFINPLFLKLGHR